MARPKTKKCDTCEHRKDDGAKQICMERRMNVTSCLMLDCQKYKRDRSKKKDDAPAPEPPADEKTAEVDVKVLTDAPAPEPAADEPKD